MMKKKIYIFIIILLLVCTIVVAVITHPKKVKSTNEDSTNIVPFYMGIYDKRLIDQNNYILTNFDEYKKYFDSKDITEEDFENNNYIVVPITYDSCSESDIKISGSEIIDNQIDVLVSYTAKCGLCASQYIYYLLKVDKDVKDVNINLKYEATNDPECDPDIAYKPIIYLYPENTMDVSVKLGNEDDLTTTYPKYDNSWDVIASPNGRLIDKKTGREQYGLYWEGKNHNTKVEKEGFIVKGEDTIKFLEEKLSILGLTEREADEFIIYWLPKLEDNKYNYIRFETLNEINTYMPLNITPKPDSIIRILMDYKPLDEKITVEEQILVSPKRNGFTVVEWGGSLID